MFTRTLSISVIGKTLIIKATDANLPILNFNRGTFQKMFSGYETVLMISIKLFGIQGKTHHEPMPDGKVDFEQKSINFSCCFFLSFALQQHYV